MIRTKCAARNSLRISRLRMRKEENEEKSFPVRYRRSPLGISLPSAIHPELMRGRAISVASHADFNSIGSAHHTASACGTTWSSRFPACAQPPTCPHPLRATRGGSPDAPARPAAAVRHSAATARRCRTANSSADRPRAKSDRNPERSARSMAFSNSRTLPGQS